MLAERTANRMSSAARITIEPAGEAVSKPKRRTQIKQGAPGAFLFEMHESARSHRAPLGQEPLWELLVTVVAGGAAEAGIGSVLDLLKDTCT